MARPATTEDVTSLAGVCRAVVSVVYRDAPGARAATPARVLATGTEPGRPHHQWVSLTAPRPLSRAPRTPYWTCTDGLAIRSSA